MNRSDIAEIRFWLTLIAYITSVCLGAPGIVISVVGWTVVLALLLWVFS